MKYSQLLIPSLRENPRDAEITSHILMIRAGYIRKLGAGLYTFLPLGTRVIQKIINIIREEMNRAGAQELIAPILIPAEYWKESGRYTTMGKEMIRLKDRHNVDMVLGPTHEEVFTAVVRENVKSYRDLPLNLYQINTKFRDEIRPRYGVMRCREFIMKDAYSFDIDEEGLEKNYQAMRVAYRRIFERCGLNVFPVLADTGNMGGSASEEFMVPSAVGEETIIQCPKCNYIANVEKATSKLNIIENNEELKTIEEVYTPNIKTINDLTKFFNITPDKFIKTLLYNADNEIIIAVIRGDLEINETKLKNILGAVELNMANEEEIFRITKAPAGFVSPVGINNVKIIADESVQYIKNGITGANKKDYHIINVNINRDFKPTQIADIRTVKEGDLCPVCDNPLSSCKGIEVGHIFKLGYKYTKSMNVKVLDKNGNEIYPIMGCYGIGVGRTMACVIEQSHDKDGIIWPFSIAPFHIIIIPLDMSDNNIFNYTNNLYQELSKSYDVLIDDRDERPGVKFKDADLIGIPLRIVIGKAFKENNEVEVKLRKSNEKILLKSDEVINYVNKIIKENL